MESGTSRWAPSAGWTLISGTGLWRSATHAWSVPSEDSESDESLTLAQSITVPVASPVLSFWHGYNTEAFYDGGYLEYSLDGTTWFDILSGNGHAVPANSSRFLQGGYTQISRYTSRSGWLGVSGGFQQVRVSLSDFAGQSIYLRWRFITDTSVAVGGWFVDDVALEGCTTLTAPARSIAVNSTARDILNSARSEVWYKTQLFANRSYQVSAWTVDEDGAPGVNPITLGIFSDAAGTVPATPAPTSSGGGA